MPVVRIDNSTHSELLRRRLPGERNHNPAIWRALRESELEGRLRKTGLSTREMAELSDLRVARGAL